MGDLMTRVSAQPRRFLPAALAMLLAACTTQVAGQAEPSSPVPAQPSPVPVPAPDAPDDLWFGYYRSVDPCALLDPQVAARLTDGVPDFVGTGAVADAEFDECDMHLIAKDEGFNTYRFTVTLGTEVGDEPVTQLAGLDVQSHTSPSIEGQCDLRVVQGNRFAINVRVDSGPTANHPCAQ